MICVRVTKKLDPRLKPWDKPVLPTPRSANHFALAPLAMREALDDLIQRLAEGQDPMELATRFALLTERARILRMQMDVVDSTLSVATQLMASRMADWMDLPHENRPDTFTE